MSAPEGRVLGAYQLKERIGPGEIGEVYRASHLQLGREAAIKLLPANLAGESDFLRRFEREAASVAALTHPNILPIYDFGEQDGILYLVMPYIRGGTLKDRLERGDVPPAQIARSLTQIAEALDFAHGKGILHRDVKPTNILLDEHDQAYLADFGIARALEGNTRLPRTDASIGTPEYMAPEQARGQADHRSDLYALGVILYQMLTGQVPFSGNSTVEVLMKHLQQPIPLEPLRGTASQAFGPILQRALPKDPHHRYQVGRDLMQAVNAAVAQASFNRWASAPIAVAAMPRPSYGTTQSGWRILLIAPVTLPPGHTPQDLPPATGVAQARAARPRTKSVPPPADRPSKGDPVECTVFAPSRVPYGASFLVQVFAHLPKQAAMAALSAQEFDETAQRRVVKALLVRVPRGTTLEFHLHMPGLAVAEPVQSLVWRGTPQSVQFAVQTLPPGASPAPGDVLGTVTVSHHAIPISQITFKVALVPPMQASSNREPVGDDARHYTFAFISYASRDREEVLKRVQMLKLIGIDYFQDVLSLEPGDRWARELYRKIDQCDLFLLFWSSAALASEWVLMEARYALAQKRGDESAPPKIMPVIIEGPTVAPPPPDLQHLHFNDPLLYALAVEAAVAGRKKTRWWRIFGSVDA